MRHPMAIALAALSPVSGWRLLTLPLGRSGEEATYQRLGLEWTSRSAFSLDEIAMRWSLPPDAYSTDGLGGGISWALHRDFCARLLPLFPEEPGGGGFFLTCDALRDAVARAMAVWSLNHRAIHFVDATRECADVAGVECAAVELFIVPSIADELASSHDGWIASMHPNLSAASLDSAPFTTAGRRLPRGIGIRQALMRVRTAAHAGEFCWYLDPGFCALFHRFPTLDLTSSVRLASATLFGVVLAIGLWTVAPLLLVLLERRRRARTAGGGGDSAHSASESERPAADRQIDSHSARSDATDAAGADAAGGSGCGAGRRYARSRWWVQYAADYDGRRVSCCLCCVCVCDIKAPRSRSRAGPARRW